MAVQIRRDSTVIDSLRSSRRASDTVSSLREGSMEHSCERVRQLIESSAWKHGPATLVATFHHHAVARTTNGNLVRVEWSADQATGDVQLGAAKVFESPTPVADIGHELFATAKAAVEKIFAEDFDGLDPMISSITEALDVSGDLQRRVVTEVAVRAIRRNAWWHHVVSEHYEGNLLQPPAPQTEGADVIARSVDELLATLKQAATSVAESARELDKMSPDKGVTAIASDVAQDVTNAIAALMNTDKNNQQESVNVYEAVVTVSNYLLSGADFLAKIAQAASTKNRE